MRSSLILFREESRPPRLLTWSLVLLGAGVVTSAGVRELHGTQREVFTFVVLGTALCVAILLEFLAVVLEVRETEVRYSFTPFYRRRIVIADIEDWTVKTYQSPANSSARYSWRPPKHCVELAMKDGSIFTVMSARPEQLSTAIGTANRMVVGK
jgi:hypothetical protein